jgi:hypothetical protein
MTRFVRIPTPRRVRGFRPRDGNRPNRRSFDEIVPNSPAPHGGPVIIFQLFITNYLI